jgi:hypothetical protein
MTTLFRRNAPFTRTLVCLAKQLAYVVTITGTPDDRIFMGDKDQRWLHLQILLSGK